jgi:hypothetical protein
MTDPEHGKSAPARVNPAALAVALIRELRGGRSSKWRERQTEARGGRRRTRRLQFRTGG